MIRQRPDSGILHRGDRLRLVVSRGPHLVQVPGVVGFGEEAATEELTAAGFEVDVQPYEPANLGFHIVADQSPGEDEQAPFGSTVTIYVL